MSRSRREERLRELAMDNALGELSPARAADLEGLDAPGRATLERYELAAAALHLALLGDELEAPPPALRARLNQALRRA